MAILKSPPKPPKNETLQIRVEETIRSKLTRYAEFIDSSESYVVSEALKFLFKKDAQFNHWLSQQANREIDGQTPKEAISKGETIQLELK